MNEEMWAPSLTWKLRTQTDLDLLRYREYWGDEYGWTALLPIVWSSYEASGFTIKPVLKTSGGTSDTYAAASYWSAAIHLLGLGMGWTDIGEGLRNWRETHYREQYHPILDFVMRNYGEDIRALEVWFGVNQRYRLQETLCELAGKPLDPMDRPTDYSNYLQWEIDYVDVPREARTLATWLLDGGDALHLEDHVVSSVQGSDERGVEPWLKPPADSKYKVVTFGQYGGWAKRLANLDEVRPHDTDVHPIDRPVALEIVGIGRLGTFVLHQATNRWFAFSHSYGIPSLQWQAHLWGNPNVSH